MSNQILKSEDGSNTLISEKFGVTYHSRYGALEESITVFLSAGLQYHVIKGKTNISILEMGFGTGLNAFLTYLQKKEMAIHVSYTGVERYPISIAEALSLEYPKLLNTNKQEESVFLQMHQTASSDAQQLTEGFLFTKILGDIHTISIPHTFDVIYYDAFAPNAQEDLWTEDMMEKMYGWTAPGGVLVTYCAKGSFKRALKSVGYHVEALPGPGKKREMTRAIKPN